MSLAMTELAQAAKRASRSLMAASTEQKDTALRGIAQSLRESESIVCAANASDMQHAREAGKNDAFLDRLRLDAGRIETMAKAVEEIAALSDPVGEVTERWTRPNGLLVRKERLPLGVVMMVYEARPNVTTDAAALCLKSGNATILRGGSESLQSNRALIDAIHRGLHAAALPSECVQLVPTADRQSMLELLQLEGLIDLCIPRGGEGLIRFVVEHARIPVVKHYLGVCHVYVESSADLAMAEGIVINAKTSRPGVCNAAECLLVDAAIASTFLPVVAKSLVERGVELRCDETALRLLKKAQVPALPAQTNDFGREFLSLTLAVKVVSGFDDALAHIARYGSEHTEAIVTRNSELSKRFSREVCASGVIVNASTRFNDGGELGLGAEIGISTSRLHAFGPMGLKELTAQKYVVEGQGQVR